MDAKVSKDKHIRRWIDWENVNYIWWKSIKKLCIKTKKLIYRGKRNKTLSEVKPVKNINKNPQIFIESSHIQKEFTFSHKLQSHVYE